MIDHRWATRLAATAIDFTLDPKSRDELDAHLRGCIACRADVGAYVIDARRLAALPPIAPPRHLRATIGLRRRRSRIGLLAVAVLIALVTLATVLISGAVVDRLRREPVPFPAPTSNPSAATSAAPSSTAATRIGLAWDRVDDPDLVPDQSVQDSTGMGGVIAGGPGAIAWGWVYWDGPQLWTTADGVDWTRANVEADGTSTSVSAAVLDLAPGGPGYVAVGDDAGSSDGRRAAVWTSPDGMNWQRVSDDPAFTDASMTSTIEWQGSMLAFGRGATISNHEHILWASPDGLVWERVTLTLPAGLAEIYRPVAAAGRLWAMGMAAKGEAARKPVVITSSDGRTWVAADAPWVGELHSLDGALLAVANAPNSIPGDPTSEPDGQLPPGVFRLAESGSWEPLTNDLRATVNDLLAVDGTLVMVGADARGCAGDCRAGAWRSTNGGVTWDVIVADDVASLMVSVAALPDGTLVGVGVASVDAARTTTAFWVSSPAGP